MKKLSLFFVAFALFSFVVLFSCKGPAKEAAGTETEEVMEAAETTADTVAAADTAAPMEAAEETAE